MTKIEWADVSWNPVTGCTPVSEGCKHCYAKRMAQRMRGRFGYPADDPFRVKLQYDRIEQPLHWRKPRRIFVCSMSDIFHQEIPDVYILRIFAIASSRPEHVFMILTKRPERMLQFSKIDFPKTGHPIRWPLPNVWIGVTAENQWRAEERIPILLRVQAAVRFVSVEPMLGPVDLTRLDNGGEETYNALTAEIKPRKNDSYKFRTSDTEPLSWVICGAETGPDRRFMNRGWAHSLRDQCQEASVPFFFKKDSNGNHDLDGEILEQWPKA